MTGKEYQGVAMALEMPESLVEYSRKQKVAPKLASMMLAVQELILASKVSKGGKKKGVDLSKVDWKRVHGACKDLLG
jgi:hypothetical protein